MKNARLEKFPLSDEEHVEYPSELRAKLAKCRPPPDAFELAIIAAILNATNPEDNPFHRAVAWYAEATLVLAEFEVQPAMFWRTLTENSTMFNELLADLQDARVPIPLYTDSPGRADKRPNFQFSTAIDFLRRNGYPKPPETHRPVLKGLREVLGYDAKRFERWLASIQRTDSRGRRYYDVPQVLLIELIQLRKIRASRARSGRPLSVARGKKRAKGRRRPPV